MSDTLTVLDAVKEAFKSQPSVDEAKIDKYVKIVEACLPSYIGNPMIREIAEAKPKVGWTTADGMLYIPGINAALALLKPGLAKPAPTPAVVVPPMPQPVAAPVLRTAAPATPAITVQPRQETVKAPVEPPAPAVSFVIGSAKSSGDDAPKSGADTSAIEEEFEKLNSIPVNEWTKLPFNLRTNKSSAKKITCDGKYDIGMFSRFDFKDLKVDGSDVTCTIDAYVIENGHETCASKAPNIKLAMATVKQEDLIEPEKAIREAILQYRELIKKPSSSGVSASDSKEKNFFTSAAMKRVKVVNGDLVMEVPKLSPKETEKAIFRGKHGILSLMHMFFAKPPTNAGSRGAIIKYAIDLIPDIVHLPIIRDRAVQLWDETRDHLAAITNPTATQQKWLEFVSDESWKYGLIYGLEISSTHLTALRNLVVETIVEAINDIRKIAWMFGPFVWKFGDSNEDIHTDDWFTMALDTSSLIDITDVHNAIHQFKTLSKSASK